jgi:phage regulator Rha-like protein
LLLAINFQIDNCHSCQYEIDNFEVENVGKEPVELEMTKDYCIIISAKNTKERERSQQVKFKL